MTCTRSRGLTALVGLALVAACSSGGGGSATTRSVTATGPSSDQQAALDMTDSLAFEPSEVRASVGTLTLVIDNVGRVPHNLTFADEALGKTDTVQGGKQASLTVALAKAGTYRFTCTFHSGMDGKVVVTEKRP